MFGLLIFSRVYDCPDSEFGKEAGAFSKLQGASSFPLISVYFWAVFWGAARYELDFDLIFPGSLS